MSAASPLELDTEVSHALSALEVAPSELALDALAAPNPTAAALARLPKNAAFLLRAAPPLTGDTPEYGPEPASPFWIRGRAGSPNVRIAPLRLANGERPREARAAQVHLELRELPCCDAPSCKQHRTLASVWIELDPTKDKGPRRLLVTSTLDLDPALARSRAAAVAIPLAQALAIPLEPTEEGSDEPHPKPDEAKAEPLLPASKLARFTMLLEGERLVLRDHGSRGPRASSRSKAIIGAILAAAAVATWIEASRILLEGDRNLTLGAIAVAALVTLGAVAFLSVARFAASYQALSAPLVWIGRDRFVVAPWVSRAGAIGVLPEGRLGAAIALEEVRNVSTPPRGNHIAIEIDSDHGPMDVLLADDPALASFWASALRRALSEMAHPNSRVSARKRFRDRAA